MPRITRMDLLPIRSIVLNSLVITVALTTLGCTRFDVLNSLVPACGYHRLADIPYGPLPRQKLDIYEPEKFTSPAGVVVFFYGGDWQNGKRTTTASSARLLLRADSSRFCPITGSIHR